MGEGVSTTHSSLRKFCLETGVQHSYYWVGERVPVPAELRKYELSYRVPYHYVVGRRYLQPKVLHAYSVNENPEAGRSLLLLIQIFNLFLNLFEVPFIDIFSLVELHDVCFNDGGLPLVAESLALRAGRWWLSPPAP